MRIRIRSFRALKISFSGFFSFLISDAVFSIYYSFTMMYYILRWPEFVKRDSLGRSKCRGSSLSERYVRLHVVPET